MTAPAVPSAPSVPCAPCVTVNGDQVPLDGVAAHTTTLDWLRDRGLTGAKEGCAEGECGACSVLVARPGVETETEWTAVNACLVPVAALDGQEVVTSEGLGTSSDLHPVQQELAVRGGSQCGYCTPGFVCSLAAEFYRAGRVSTGDEVSSGSTADEHHCGVDMHALSGNLCRCTGYRPIRDAAYALGAPADDDTFAARRQAPPPAPRPTRLAVDGAEYVRPATLAETLALLTERPEAQVVAGSTDWGVEVNIRGRRAPLVVAVDRLPELRELRIEDDVIELGAALTLTEIERRLDGRVPLLAELFPQFASRLIRNSATIGGNIGTASPIGDAPPALLALDAEVVLASPRGERVLPLADYFTGYRETVRAADELIRSVRIPLPLAPLVAFHKIAKRRFDDISSVAVGFALEVADGTVTRARIGLGGVAATPIRAVATEDALVGRPWTEESVRRAAAVLATEGTPMDDHRASASYRSAMLGQSLLRLFWSRQARGHCVQTPKKQEVSA
ncbi:xanthine dehydrogenase small subunit [Nocardioides luteus]|uniref:Dehydrogenase n=1 Tax=Nocardioides luteus TaxID=1844 RepID=A0ABQ5T2P9_9ACTN|nr:FAD binding domain-containing protein [Nocardioides luteus]MDR7313480.1 xanthine dehydrogenase small subunit [Nocardioides luteus]GGR74481.1 dehydrogenase [Nocardioides luteus]GLJ70735.1 dehydrogenase [Nocardioides luteus]